MYGTISMWTVNYSLRSLLVFRRFPAGALEHRAAKADRDRLVLCVIGERLLAELAADTALLVTAEWKLV